MTPVYETRPKYTITYVYKNPSTEEEYTKNEVVYLYDNLKQNIQDIMNTNKEKVDDGYKFLLYDIQIKYEEEAIDKTVIKEWKDLRPGDFVIHTNSSNNISSDTELSFDFYVAKLSRAKNTYVDKYNICWHAMQGVFLIARYPDLECNDKTKLIEVLVIYDERMYPSIQEQEKEVAKKWIYSKVAKYVGMYAPENPLKVPLSSIEV